MAGLLYYENASFGKEGLNTHVMSWTMCITMSNFLDRDFFFDCEIPCSTPPDYASHPDYKERFGILLESERSLISDLMAIPNRRVLEIDREVESKLTFNAIHSKFMTTRAMKEKFEGGFLWDAFAVGREDIVREDLDEKGLVEWTHTTIASPAAFYFLPKQEKRELLSSAALRYREDIETLAAKMVADFGKFNAIHLRLGDFFTNYSREEYDVDVERFARFVDANIPDKDLPILIATDGLQEKERFEKIFPNYKLVFIDEVLFGEYRGDFAHLAFTDFNSVTIVDQLICAAAETFIGTYRSTMTAMIHRLRQERYANRDFHFFPDPKVSRFLNDEMKLAPDRSGFFDWNRFSFLSEEFRDIGWRREWDHEYTMVDV